MCPTSFERAYSTCAGCFLEKQEEVQAHTPSAPDVGQVGQPHQHGIVAGTTGGIVWSTGRDSGTTEGPTGRNHTTEDTCDTDYDTLERRKDEDLASPAERLGTGSAFDGCGWRLSTDRGTATMQSGASRTGWTGSARCRCRSMRVRVLTGGGDREKALTMRLLAVVENADG